VPGLVIVRSDESLPEHMAPVVEERPSRADWIAELVQRVRERFVRFTSKRPSLSEEMNGAVALASRACQALG
jgi:hypothetical protein